MSKIKVNSIEAATGTTITIPSGQTLDVSSATVTLPATLPASSGANLTNLNASNLSSGTVASARLNLTTQGDIVYRDGSGLQRLGAGTSGQALLTQGTGANPIWGSIGGGKINQVIYTQKTDASTISGTSSSPNYTNVVSASITPSAATSKVLILARLHAGGPSGAHTYVRMRRDSTFLPLADSAGSRTLVHSSTGFASTWHGSDQVINMLDSPNTTSATNYHIVLGTEGTSYVNRSDRDTDSDADHRGTSDLILMEVLA
jgi:hypothetical protein